MEIFLNILNFLTDLFHTGLKAFEPYQGSISMNEKQYSAIQGMMHGIGWTLIIIFFIFLFKYMKKYTQQDERMKKYYGKSEENQK